MKHYGHLIWKAVLTVAIGGAVLVLAQRLSGINVRQYVGVGS